MLYNGFGNLLNVFKYFCVMPYNYFKMAYDAYQMPYKGFESLPIAFEFMFKHIILLG